MPFTLYATQQFKDDLQGFVGNPAVQDKLPKTFSYLEDDPRKHQGSLQTEPLRRFKGSGEAVQHSRVDQSYRIMWRWDGPSAIILLRIGAHDFINNYATFSENEIPRVILRRPAGEEPPPQQVGGPEAQHADGHRDQTGQVQSQERPAAGEGLGPGVMEGEVDAALAGTGLEGRVRLRQGDFAADLGPGDYLVWDGSFPHSAENIGDCQSRILICTPGPNSISNSLSPHARNGQE